MFRLTVLLLPAIFFAGLHLKAKEEIQPEKQIQFTATTFVDQHDQKLELSPSTRFLLFSSDMDVSRMVTQTLTEKPLDLEAHQILYVADIHKMPSLIFKMAAKPKMKKYPYRMALDTEGSETASWPKKEKSLTVIQLSDLKTEKISFLTTEIEIRNFFADFHAKQSGASEGSEKVQFGAALKLNTEPLSIDQAISKYTKASSKKEILVKATIDRVCQKKGCWMSLKSNEEPVRVVFKDYSFFVPFDLAGKTVLTEGILTQKKLSLSETKHYVADAGGDPSTVKEARTEFQFIASGVLVTE